MKNWFLDVPKILHIYWGGKNLVYLRYLTVKSFIKYNPDWQIILWTPKTSYTDKRWFNTGQELIDSNLCEDYSKELFDLPLIILSVDFESLGFQPDTAEIHKADYIRINSLGMYGGVWSDLDIIYFKPMTELKVNVPENKDKEVYVCIYDYGHSTGFNMAKERSFFFNKLLEILNKEYNPYEYQCWGPDIFNKYFKHLSDIPNAINLDMDVVYAHNATQVNELLNNSTARFTDRSIGCHWYAGNTLWGDFFNKTNGGKKNLPESIIKRLIDGCE